MRRIIITEESRHSYKKSEWLAIYHEVQELVPDNEEFSEEYQKLAQIISIIKSMKKSELNDFADELASKMEYQALYRDGRWLDSPEQYNTKTQILVDAIYEDLLVHRIGKSVAKSIDKRGGKR